MKRRVSPVHGVRALKQDDELPLLVVRLTCASGLTVLLNGVSPNFLTYLLTYLLVSFKCTLSGSHHIMSSLRRHHHLRPVAVGLQLLYQSVHILTCSFDSLIKRLKPR